MARAHAALVAEWARLGHDAHGLRDKFTFDEVRGCMRSLKNHKAAGGDGIPAELLKYSGGTGVQVLTHLFNAVLATRCVPSAWRQGIVVHLAKGDDGGDCSNYRPLILLPIIDKLFAKLLSDRISRVVCLHDQKYAFRPGRGTLNSLHNLLAVVRQRNQAKKATYVCFFDAEKGYDSVPHALLLHRLLQCGVTGPAFAVLAAMYSSASSRVWVGSALSPAFAVQRGVAQGCPLSPLLYAIFADPVLQDMQALSHPDLLWVGPPATRRKLVGQAYADDLAGIAATQQGLQRVVQAVHLHSLRWGWSLNVPNSIVLVFGMQSLCARLGAPDLWWRDSRLPTADTVKYVGLRLESSGGWAAQQVAGAANGWAALHRRLPVLRSRHLSAATKLLVLRSCIAPCMSYGMELWRPSKRGANMTAVLIRAAKLISGICRDASHTALFMGRSVNEDVMLADLGVLSADDHCRMAHARQYAWQAATATAAALYARNDPCSLEFDVALSAAYAPDYMGAAAWNGLHTRDGWYSFARTCHDTALSHCVCPEAALTPTDPFVVGGAKRATCKDIRSGISAAALVRRGLRQPTQWLHGRPRETAQHRRPRWVADLRNPTARDHLWHPAARSVYTNAPSAVVHLIMSLRSSRLIGDHLVGFGATAAVYACSLCQERVFPSCPDFGSTPRAPADREHRWRHIEHLLFECPGILGAGGTLAVNLLRDDLFRACFGSDHASAVLLAAFPSDRTPVVAPWLVSSRSSSTLLLPWHVPPP